MKIAAVIAAGLLLTVILHGQEGLTDADKALFDELRVSEEVEKTARELMEKPEKKPPPVAPGMPAEAARLLDRLAVYEASLNGINDEIIGRSRKKLSGELITLSGNTAEPLKTELIATAKSFEGLASGAELPAAMPDSEVPGEWLIGDDHRWYYRDGTIKTKHFTGTWRWLHQSTRIIVADYANAEFVDVLKLVTERGKPPILDGVNQRGDRWPLAKGKPDPGKAALPAEANKLITAARSQEAQARAKWLKEVQEKRGRVATWLVEKAKTRPPGEAKVMLAGALDLRADAGAAAGKNNYRRHPEAFRGKLFNDQKRRTWEFLPNNTVRCNGLSWGAWEWSKAENEDSILIWSGGPGKPESIFIVRKSATTAGKLYFFGYEEKFEATVKP